MPQSYESHAHHPVPTYVAFVFWLLAAGAFVGAIVLDWDTRDEAFGWLMAAVMMVISIGRQYTVRLQDRIIQLEVKVRCAELLPAGDEGKLALLSPKQVAALRFASDEELGPLLDRAVGERLSPAEIKKAIRSWKPDLLRT